MNLRNYATHVNLGDSLLSALIQSTFYIWDFELTEMKKKVFPVHYIQEFEGEESFIDLLSSLPKAS